MFRLKLAKDDTNIDFMKARMIALVISGVLVIASVATFFIHGVNKGIDFEGGILMEVGAPVEADIAGYRDILSGLDLGDVAVQSFGTPEDALIRIERQVPPDESGMSDAAAQQQAVSTVQNALNEAYEGLSFRRVEVVGPKVSGELMNAGIMSVTFAVIAVLIYIWFRFEWHFGVGAVAALVHDVLLTLGFFSVTGLEFNLSIVAAILTIVGYSLNDTVVVYDRVRENMRKYASHSMKDILNMSLNQTLSRTLMTSVTTLLALFALFIFGGAVIQGFTAAMIWGVFVGTYSSVFIASPVLMFLGLSARHVALPSEEEKARP